MTYTGRFRYRFSRFRRRLILQLEYRQREWDGYDFYTLLKWKDARPEDLLQFEKHEQLLFHIR